jgi:hypothetical protein
MRPQPSRHVQSKGAAPLSGAEKQTAFAISAYAQNACLLSLQMRSFKGKKIHVGLKPKNMRVAYRDMPGTNEARGLKER